MIRFVVIRKTWDGLECKQTDFETVDCDAPALEAVLRRGGRGGGPNNDAYDITELVGAELLEG